MSDKDWSWLDESSKEATVIPQTYAIAVYLNPDNDIVIRQQGYPEDDAVIIIPRGQAKKVADAIKSALRD